MVIIILLSFQVVNATVIKQVCGNYRFEVKILKGEDVFEREFELFSIDKSAIKIRFFKTRIGTELSAKCVTSERGRVLMLFQLLCGGNGCPEDIYGIFDPKEKKLLVDPYDWPKGNEKKVWELIGYPPPYVTRDNGEFFCCFERQY